MKLRDGSLGWSGDKGRPGGAYMYVGNAWGEGGGSRGWADKGAVHIGTDGSYQARCSARIKHVCIVHA